MVCDYCGKPIDIEADAVSLMAFRETFWDVGMTPKRKPVAVAVGQYHATDCIIRIRDAIRLTEAFGQSVEDRGTKSGQWVAAQRRKHRHAEGRG